MFRLPSQGSRNFKWLKNCLRCKMSRNQLMPKLLQPNQIKAYTIAYTPQLFASVEAPFLPLDHTANERSDWQEYWPIRKFLLNNELDDDCLYGFLSPRFTDKTGLDGARLMAFLLKEGVGKDIVTISPQPDMGAMFLNVFAQNELFDPGFCDTADAFFKTIGIDIDVQTCVMDSTQIVFSNYFFAKPAFWRRWLQVNERIFYLCEEQTEFATKIGLLKKTSYRDGVNRKVFLMERIASSLLISESHWQVGNYNTFLCAYSASRLNEFPSECKKADALKIAWNITKNDFYIKEFYKIISQTSDILSFNINNKGHYK